MHPRILTIIGLSLGLASAPAQDLGKDQPPAFPGLKEMAVSGGESPSSQRISYDAALSELVDKPLAMEEGEPEVRRLLLTRLDRESKTRHFIDFDPGPSADPSFIVTDEKTGKEVGQIAADSLALPGNGFIYATARSNNMHLLYQKFAIRDGKLVEIKQPFSYVGLETKAKVPLTLKATQSGGETIASIPAGEPLQVVLSDGEQLLIKTRFGLLGWWKMNTKVLPESAEIEGIYYAGD